MFYKIFGFVSGWWRARFTTSEFSLKIAYQIMKERDGDRRWKVHHIYCSLDLARIGETVTCSSALCRVTNLSLIEVSMNWMLPIKFGRVLFHNGYTFKIEGGPEDILDTYINSKVHSAGSRLQSFQWYKCQLARVWAVSARGFRARPPIWGGKRRTPCSRWWAASLRRSRWGSACGWAGAASWARPRRRCRCPAESLTGLEKDHFSD